MKTATSAPRPVFPARLTPLDDMPPSPEQYARFYALAKQVSDAAPWEWLEETQVVAVERDVEETDFISVMGSLGTHFAIAVYPSLVSFDRFMTLDQLPQHEACDIFFEIPQHQLVFGSKSDLFPGERETVGASGIRFKNGKWPSAQAFVPGYFPWKAGTAGMENLCVALEQLLAVFNAGTEIPHAPGMGAAFLTRFRENGVWRTTLRKHKPKSRQYTVTPPNDLMNQVLSLPVRVMCLEADCFPVMARIGKPKGRPACPHQLMLVDRATDFLFPTALLMPEEGMAWSFTQASTALLKQLVKIGFRPSAMAFAGDVTAAWGEQLCGRLGISVDDSPCDALIECRLDFEKYF